MQYPPPAQGEVLHSAGVFVKGLRSNLLGLPAIRALNLATRLDETTAEQTPLIMIASTIYQRYKKVFQGLGNLGEEYQIQLQPEATPPRSVHTPKSTVTSEEEGIRRTEEDGGNGGILKS